MASRKPRVLPVWVIIDSDTGTPRVGYAERTKLAALMVNGLLNPPGVVTEFIPAPPKKRSKRNARK